MILHRTNFLTRLSRIECLHRKYKMKEYFSEIVCQVYGVILVIYQERNRYMIWQLLYRMKNLHITYTIQPFEPIGLDIKSWKWINWLSWNITENLMLHSSLRGTTLLPPFLFVLVLVHVHVLGAISNVSLPKRARAVLRKPLIISTKALVMTFWSWTI